MTNAYRVICAAVMTRDGEEGPEFLLIQNHEGTWDFPGNEVHSHYSTLEVAIQAAGMQTGYEFKPIRFLGQYWPICDNSHPDELPRYSLHVVFLGRGGVLLSENPSSRIKWFSVSEIEHSCSPHINQIINDYLAGLDFSLAVIKTVLPDIRIPRQA